jgi:hypothetical protein
MAGKALRTSKQGPKSAKARASKKLEGGCFCGAVRYELTSNPMFVNCCHCHDCQRQTGTAFVINAIIEADRVKLTKGRPQPVLMSTDSGGPHDIYRCSKCQTALWSDYGRRPFRFVRVGTLDNPARIPPDAHIFVRSKLPWVGLPQGTPAFKVYYETKKLWPKDSLARRQKVLG